MFVLVIGFLPAMLMMKRKKGLRQMIMMASFQPTIWKAENNDGANKDHSDEDDDEYASDENNDGGDEGQSDGDDDEYAKDENYDLEKIIRNLMRIIIMTMPMEVTMIFMMMMMMMMIMMRVMMMMTMIMTTLTFHPLEGHS